MTDVQVSGRENAEYQQFVREQIRRYPPPTPQSVLWHYTSGESLLGIINSGEFWLTQLSCVNDTTELRYSQSLLRDALQQIHGHDTPTEDEAVLYDIALPGLSTDIARTSDWYIGCFSAIDDDLSQWRAYGGGEGGYAICFDTSAVWHSAGLIPGGGTLAPVCYQKQVHAEIAQSVAEATISFYKKGLDERGNVDRRAWAASFLQAWAEAITYIAPSIKHPAFAAEKEWRLLRRLQLMDLPRMKFRQRQSMLARHLPVALRILGSPTESKLLPIVGVRVGPSRHKEISQVGVADLLRATGYPVSVYTNVSISEVPFQAL